MTIHNQRSTWGSKRPRGRNSWELRWPDGRETFHGTAKEADRRLAEIRIKYEGAKPGMTLTHFWESYYHDYINEFLAASTVPGYVRVWNREIKPIFGDFPLKDVTPRKIQEWLEPMTGGKARHCKAVLSAIYTRAFALELVEDNPAQRRFIMPKTKAKGQRTKEIYTKYELDSIFQTCTGEVWEAAFILAAFGGASREEAMGVKVDEIIFDNGVAIVPIVRGVQRLEGEVKVLDWTKNEHRKRDLVIIPPYSLRLEQIVKECKAREDIWLTDNGFGFPICPNTMANSAYKDWFTKQPIRYIPFSNLRHAYATYTSKNVNPLMMAKLLGHSQPTTTYNNYYRPSTQDKIDALMGNYGQNKGNMGNFGIEQAPDQE